MASDVEEERMKPKIDPFGLMKIRVSNYLTEDKRKKICMLWDFTPTDTENVKDGTDLLTLMQGKGIFDRHDVNNLKETLDEVDLEVAVKHVEKYIRHIDESQGEMQHCNPKERGLERATHQQKTEDTWRSYKENISYINCTQGSLPAYETLPDVLHFLLIGKTGSGKSSTGNTILGRRYFKECDGTESETNVISHADVKDVGVFIKVIDTPGLFETGLRTIVQGYQNRRLCFEIAKTAFKFRGGIHLFLLVYNPTTKFTQEEENTIKHLEDTLTKKIYDYCVLVLTHSKGKFVTNSLRGFLEAEKKRRGKFAELIHAVHDRVVAVDNTLEEALLKDRQRHHLLNSLAEVVHGNKGAAYSNDLFERADREIEREQEERRIRFDFQGSILKMRTNIDQYAYNLLSSLDMEVSDLRNLKLYFDKNMESVIQAADVGEYQYIDEKDVREYLRTFIDRNESLIKRCVELTSLKSDETKRTSERQEEEMNTIENTCKSQKIVAHHIVKYLKYSSKKNLGHLQNILILPEDQWQELLNELRSNGIEYNVRDIQDYVKSTFFTTPEKLKSYFDEVVTLLDLEREINNKLEQGRKNCKIKFETAKRVETYIPEFTKKFLPHDVCKVEKLKRSLHERDESVISDMLDVFIRDYMQLTHGVCVKEVCKASFHRNINLILGVIDILGEEKAATKQENEKRLAEKKKHARLRLISDVIDTRLEGYLTGKSLEELKDIDNQLSNNEVPDDIFKEIMENVLKHKEIEMESSSIYGEVLIQLQEKRKIVDVLMKRASVCFPGTCTVSTRSCEKVPISLLEVGDDVLVYDSVGNLHYEKVYLLSHANAGTCSMYVQILTERGKILLISPNHFLPIGSLHNNVPAKAAAVGQPTFSVTDGILTKDIIISVSYKICNGAFCPMTMNGNIVVNNVAVSCFTTFFNPSWGHFILCPVRIMFRYLPESVFNTLLPYDSIEGMPVMLAFCRSGIIWFRSLFRRLLEIFDLPKSPGRGCNLKGFSRDKVLKNAENFSLLGGDMHENHISIA